MADDPALILARHVWDTRFEQLPVDAVVAAKRDVLDTLGAAIAGSSAPGVAVLQLAKVSQGFSFVQYEIRHQGVGYSIDATGTATLARTK